VNVPVLEFETRVRAAPRVIFASELPGPRSGPRRAGRFRAARGTLLVRVLDRHGAFAEAVVFVLTRDRELTVLSGDGRLIEFERPLRDRTGQPVTHADPVRWLGAVRDLLSDSGYEVLISRLPGAGESVLAPMFRRRMPVVLLAIVAAVASMGLTKAMLAFSGGRSAHRSAVGGRTEQLLTAPASLRGSRGRAALAAVADSAARELAGSGDGSPVGFDALTGLWDRQRRPLDADVAWQPPRWWQSGLALRALVRYLRTAHDTDPAYARLIAEVYDANVYRPGTLHPVDFENKFMDDTGWWGLAWLEAFEYERSVAGDAAAASRYLRLAEAEAYYIWSSPRTCGGQGIEFAANHTPNTVTDAEFVSLAAQLSRIRSAPGPWQDLALAARWLTAARGTLGWVESTGLVNMTMGTVRATDTPGCRPAGQGMTYMQGEMADALTQMSAATGDAAYAGQATAYINRALSPTGGMLAGGVLQEPCEASASACARRSYNITVYKGLLVDAVSDWTRQTGAATYVPFLYAQASAVIRDSASDGQRPAQCSTAHACQLSMYWARREPADGLPVGLNAGSQAAGLSALTAALG
jgi:hypothetical protein